MNWSARPERGTLILVRIMIWITRRVGWGAGQALLWPITAWFYATSAEGRAASREYLAKALGRPMRAGDVFHHMHVFAHAILDRVFLIAGGPVFNVETTGLEALDALAAKGQGCVLLGAHLGSFEALRRVARQSPVPVRPLMYRANAGALSGVLGRLDPALAASIIDLGTVSAMLRAHESVARGEIVAILADRAPAAGRRVLAPFFGTPAAFPAGPFVLAASLGAPVLLFSAVRTGPRRYAAVFEPFADAIVLGRATRQADLEAWATRYAACLEARCRAHPFNWFNFYPFWEDSGHATAPRHTPSAHVRVARGGADPVAG